MRHRLFICRGVQHGRAPAGPFVGAPDLRRCPWCHSLALEPARREPGDGTGEGEEQGSSDRPQGLHA